MQNSHPNASLPRHVSSQTLRLGRTFPLYPLWALAIFFPLTNALATPTEPSALPTHATQLTQPYLPSEPSAPSSLPTKPSDARASTRHATHTIPGLKLELLWVPPGSFTMGSPTDQPDRNKAEGPQTLVTFTTGYWLGKTEVTQAQYQAITGANPSHFTNSGPNAPVERVSWTDAAVFCEKLNQRERAAERLPAGYTYTLPTEAQWEYAYRADTTDDYPGDPDTTAWHAKNSGQTTHPVAQKKPNPWGFHDLPGNILEWTHDWYGNYPGGSVTNYAGPRRGYYRTARGGSWRTETRLFRTTARSGGSEARQDYTIGFRLALSAVTPEE